MTCKLGYLALMALKELGEAALVAAGPIEPVLVADFDVVEGERRGVADLGADGSPLGGGVAGDELDLVESVVYEGLSAGPGWMWRL